jgi:hypothetical protein
MRRWFASKPAWWGVSVLAVEVIIALYVRDALIRPYGGDLLAAFFVYVLLRLVFPNAASTKLAMTSFLIGAGVEGIQWLRLPARFGTDQYTVLRIAIGTTFEWGDLVAYALGATAGWLIDERTRWLR